MKTQEIDSKYLTISYDCLSAIGNSFMLESMMGEVVMGFFQATEALYIAYYENAQSQNPMVAAGKNIASSFDTRKQDSFLQESATYFHIFLPLRRGYLACVYAKREDIGKIYAIIRGFSKKINFALSACEGVKKLEELNEKLEDKINVAVQSVREHEQMLLIQSKSAIMGEMLEMIAHQWRQPITSIGMIANNMLLNLILSEEESLDKELFQREIEDIHKQVTYLSHTIDDFRNFFKDSKKKETFDIEDILQKSMSLMKKQFEQGGITLEYINECVDVQIHSYKNELIQVILNLFNNARDAFESSNIENKKIILMCKVIKNNLLIRVKDNAGGIKEENMHKIFEPYFSTKKEKNGTGLGLHMSKIILQKHFKGTIAVLNEDNGAVFDIVFPMHYEEME